MPAKGASCTARAYPAGRGTYTNGTAQGAASQAQGQPHPAGASTHLRKVEQGLAPRRVGGHDAPHRALAGRLARQQLQYSGGERTWGR